MQTNFFRYLVQNLLQVDGGTIWNASRRPCRHGRTASAVSFARQRGYLYVIDGVRLQVGYVTFESAGIDVVAQGLVQQRSLHQS